MPPINTVGKRIRELRESCNLTQRDLASRVNINFTYLSRVENDRLDNDQTPREETLQKIADALNADVDELLILARRIPGYYRARILSEPEVFRRIISLSGDELRQMLDRDKDF